MTRFHDLDALRAFAMLLGIVLHAGLFLLPTVEFWPVHDKWGYTTEPAKCFGLMGLFRWVAAKERFWVRYMSDASYWLYLWHLPLVIGGQMLVLSWPLNVHLKLALVCTVVVVILLVVYQLGVRYTLIGTMLNGPRTRR